MQGVQDDAFFVNVRKTVRSAAKSSKDSIVQGSTSPEITANKRSKHDSGVGKVGRKRGRGDEDGVEVEDVDEKSKNKPKVEQKTKSKSVDATLNRNQAATPKIPLINGPTVVSSVLTSASIQTVDSPDKYASTANYAELQNINRIKIMEDHKTSQMANDCKKQSLADEIALQELNTRLLKAQSSAKYEKAEDDEHE